MTSFFDCAQQAALEAGTIHKQYFKTGTSARRKSTSFDLVTDADIESEKAIVSIIKKHYPDHNILAEEAQYPKTSSEFIWIIDPLDGTNNFSSGLPIFCVSIALAHRNEVVLGIIHDITRNESFTAQKGRGAFLNGTPISVSSTEKLEESILITGFYYDRGREMIETLEKIKQFFQKPILGLRRLGAAALDLCYIACGRAAGFWEFELSPWDFAAGKLIIEEAGGTVTGRHREPLPLKKSFVVASNGKIHEEMLKVLE